MNINHYVINNAVGFSKVSMLAGFVCALTASLISQELWKDAYYHFNSLSFFFYILSIYLIAIKSTPAWSDRWKTFALIALLSALTTIGDELAGTATQIGLHDLIRFASVLIIVAIRRYKLIIKWRTFFTK